MQELSFQLNDALQVGLRPDSRMQRTHKAMAELINLVPAPWGLASPSAITNPFSDAISWPFPQYLRGNGISLLAGSTTLKTVNETTWAATSVSTYNPFTDAAASITAGGPWQMVDFWDTYVLLNGACAVYKLNRQGMRGLTNLAYVTATSVPTSGCAYRGRAIFGGYSLSAWQTQWEAIADNSEFTHTPSTRGNIVFWTTIGGGDIEWALVPAKMPEDWLSYLRQGTMGWAVMPFQGNVLHVKPLGNGVMAYGEDGSAHLMPMVEPQPGFGLHFTSRVGLASRGAVAGDEHRHLFIDPSGTLWSVSPEAGVQRLGFQEYFSPMLGTHIVGSFDPTENEFYFCNDETGFVYRNGLARVEKRNTGIAFVDGGLAGITSGIAAEASFVTQRFDMGLRAIKFIQNMEIAYTGMRDVEIMARAGYDSEPVDTVWIPVNDTGACWLNQAGTDFQIAMRGTVTDAAKIDGLSVRWKLNDKRAVRGYYAGGSN